MMRGIRSQCPKTVARYPKLTGNPVQGFDCWLDIGPFLAFFIILLLLYGRDSAI
jgi:hypothetical protein